MSLLTICKAVADGAKIARPSSVASNTDPTALSLLRAVNMAGLSLMKSYPWQALRKGGTFTALAQETQTSFLPSDFDRFIPESVWDTTNKNLVIGPIEPGEWNALKAHAYSDTGRRKFIHRGNAILVIPVFSGSEAIIFEYVSKNWCQSSGGTGQSAFAADTDTGIVDEELLTRAAKLQYLSDIGQPVGAAAAEYESYFRLLTRNDNARMNILTTGDIFGSGRHYRGEPPINGSLDTV